MCHMSLGIFSFGFGHIAAGHLTPDCLAPQKTQPPLQHLHQGSQTAGPRAIYGPPSPSLRPATDIKNITQSGPQKYYYF